MSIPILAAVHRRVTARRTYHNEQGQPSLRQRSRPRGVEQSPGNYAHGAAGKEREGQEDRNEKDFPVRHLIAQRKQGVGEQQQRHKNPCWREPLAATIPHSGQAEHYQTESDQPGLPPHQAHCIAQREGAAQRVLREEPGVLARQDMIEKAL